MMGDRSISAPNQGTARLLRNADATAYQAPSSQPHQVPSRQASGPVDLSGYGGMYSQVKLPGSQSQSQSSPGSSASISGASPELEAQLSAEFASLPVALQQATKSIAVKAGCSPHWGCDGADATAQSPGAQIEIWRGAQDYYPLLAHETAHLLAYKKWGESEPPQEYVALWQSEGGVSDYGATSPTEDFAEAVQQHTEGRLQSERKRAFVQKALQE